MSSTELPVPWGYQKNKNKVILGGTNNSSVQNKDVLEGKALVWFVTYLTPGIEQCLELNTSWGDECINEMNERLKKCMNQQVGKKRAQGFSKLYKLIVQMKY